MRRGEKDFPQEIWGPPWDLAGRKLLLKKRIKPIYLILPDLTKASFGTRLRYLRKRLGHSLEQVGKSSGLSIGAIRRLEADAHEILEPRILGRLIPALGTRFKDVFPETGGDAFDFILPKTTFGGWLKNFRARRGMMRRDLARALGLSRESLRRYEAGLSRPARRVRKRLHEAFGVGLEIEGYFA